MKDKNKPLNFSYMDEDAKERWLKNNDYIFYCYI